MANSNFEKATQLLNSYSFKVEALPNQLIARYDHFSFEIIINTAPYILEEAQEIGQGTPHQAAMQLCNARFEVSVDNLEEALDEINDRKSELIDKHVPAWIRPAFKDFAGVKDSKIYNAFKNGATVYMSKAFQKNPD